MTNTIPILTPDDWKDYELIDSGDGKKLERFADYTLNRPDPRAMWKPHADTNVWDAADAAYVRVNETSGNWVIRRPPPPLWHIRHDQLTLVLKPTAFKHVGVFPEQAPNWRWITERVAGKPINVLNLFAYTGAATLAAAGAGARVTHVDASKPSLSWAKENAEASHLSDRPIRWILDDAYKFVLREARRGVTYDGIIMDPPRFGRGAKGEIWKLEDDLPKLLSACTHILSPKPSFFLLNAYTADVSSIALSRLLDDLMKRSGGMTEAGELALKDSTAGKLLPNGIFARWQADTYLPTT